MEYRETYYSEESEIIASDAENYEEKTLCVFVLDKSLSMRNHDRIGQLNAGIRRFLQDIREDTKTARCLEIAIVEFSSQVSISQPPALVDQIVFQDLQADGVTLLVEALETAFSVVEKRKKYYKTLEIPYLRPFVILISDGEPYPPRDLTSITTQIYALETQNHLKLMPIAVDESANATLRRICYTPPRLMQEKRFTEFFDWLGNSMKIVSQKHRGESVKLPPTDGWDTIRL
ncbi:MAG: VWA domain-containing protein [Bacteroidota bacterium]